MRWLRAPWVQRAFVVFLSCVFLLGGLGGRLADQALSEGIETTAVVVSRQLGRETVYEIRFVTAAGVEVTTNTSFALPGSRRGEKIPVLYDPRDPRVVAQVGSMSGAWIEWVAWLVIGVVLLGSIPFPGRRPGRPGDGRPGQGPQQL